MNAEISQAKNNFTQKPNQQNINTNIDQNNNQFNQNIQQIQTKINDDHQNNSQSGIQQKTQNDIQFQNQQQKNQIQNQNQNFSQSQNQGLKIQSDNINSNDINKNVNVQKNDSTNLNENGEQINKFQSKAQQEKQQINENSTQKSKHQDQKNQKKEQKNKQKELKEELPPKIEKIQKKTSSSKTSKSGNQGNKVQASVLSKNFVTQINDPGFNININNNSKNNKNINSKNKNNKNNIYKNVCQIREICNEKSIRFLFIENGIDDLDPTLDDLKQPTYESVYSGLSFFVRGLVFENGWKSQGFTVSVDFKRALEEYNKGADLLDPLCNFRLAQYYSSLSSSDVSKSESKSSNKKDNKKKQDNSKNQEIQQQQQQQANENQEGQKQVNSNQNQNLNNKMSQSNQNEMEDQERALFHLGLSYYLQDFWYAADFLQIYEEAEKVADSYEEKLKAFKYVIENRLSKIGPGNNKQAAECNQKFLRCLIAFKHSNVTESQQCYDNLMTFIERNVNLKGYGYRYLMFATKLLSHQTHNKNKNINQFIRIFNKADEMTIKQVYNLLLRDIQMLRFTENDNDIYFKTRSLFFELYNLQRKLFKSPQRPSYMVKQIIFYTINQFHYRKIQNYHKSHTILGIRTLSEIYEKGIGIDINYEKALSIIQEEMKISKTNNSLYAFPMYQIAKLYDKLYFNDQEKQKNKIGLANDALKHFESRVQSENIYQKYISEYYIGRIKQIFLKDQKSASIHYARGKELYKQNEKMFTESIRTFQYEYYNKKFESKNAQYRLSQAINNQLTHIDLANGQQINALGANDLTDKVLMIQKQENITFFDVRLLDQLIILHKSENCITYKGILKFNLMIDEVNQMARHQKYMDELQDQKHLGDQIIVKQMPLLKINFFEEMFRRLQKISKMKNREGLIEPRGYALKDLDKYSFELFIVYPKYQKNLREVVFTKQFNTAYEHLNFINQICHSVKQLHINGIPHGNIKPNNILYDNVNNRAVLCDWEYGNKKKVDQSDLQSKKGQKSENQIQNNKKSEDLQEEDIEDEFQETNRCVQKGYISPEQYEGKQTTFASDIFSLGMILNYYVYNAEKKYDYTAKLDYSVQGQNLINVNYKSQEDLRNLIEKMTKYQPSQRCSIHEVISDIKGIIKNYMPDAQQKIDDFEATSKVNPELQAKQEEAAKTIQKIYKTNKGQKQVQNYNKNQADTNFSQKTIGTVVKQGQNNQVQSQQQIQSQSFYNEQQQQYHQNKHQTTLQQNQKVKFSEDVFDGNSQSTKK